MAKGNEFDPYREALVVENQTIWSDEFDHLDAATRRRYESQMHANAQQAALLTYERLHSGFCRVITVTPDDMARIK